MSRDHASQVPLRTVLNHMLIPVIMAVVMALCYLGGLHKPAPHALPVAVVGPVQAAGPAAAQLQQAAGDKLDVRTYATPADATAALKQREVYGAYVLSATAPQLLVASASSDAATNVATRVFTSMAAKQGKPLAVTDVVPLSENDPIGQNGFFYLVILSIGAYATAISIAAAGATRRFRERLALTLGAGVAVPTLLLGVAATLFDMFTGHGAKVWVLSVVYGITVMGISVGLHTLVGRYSTLLFNAMFVALNFTSSGGIFPPELQPGFFGWLHDFWVGAGFIDVLNQVLYFPEASSRGGYWILAGWLLAAVGSLALAHHVELRRRHARRLARHARSMRDALVSARTDGLTPRQAMELELAEDVAV